jgi:hypothetical protein
VTSDSASDQVDLGAIFDVHTRAEFVDRDLEATMATMVDEPYLNHVPVMTGGRGREEVRRFYRDHFIGRWPADTKLVPISRTVGQDKVIDEFVVCCRTSLSWASRATRSPTSTSTGTRPPSSYRSGCSIQRAYP